MAEVGSAFVSVVPSARGFGKKLSKQVDPETKAAGKRSGLSFGKAFAIAGGATAAVGFLKDAVGQASDLNEAGTKINAIFGKQGSKAVQDFASQGAKALGQTKLEVLDSAASFGTFGKAAGLGGQDLSKFSTGFASLATDMASFFNTNPADAVEAISSGLRGEAEPLRKYGVLLDDATLRQEALRLGLIKTTKQALTPQQKVLAAQASIYKQTTDAQGDFQRTSGGLANQQRILTAQIGDLKGEIGKGLLPIVLDATKGLSKFVTGMQDGTGAGGEFVTVSKDIGQTLKPVLGLVKSGAKVFGSLPGPVKTLAIEAGIAAVVFPRLARGVAATGFAFTGTIARVKQFGAEMTYAETRAARVNAIVGKLKAGAGIAGFTLLADGARRSSGALKELETVGGAALIGFSVGGPIGGAIAGGGTALFRLATAGQRAGKQIEGARPGIASIIPTLNKVTGAATEATTALTFNSITKQGGFAALDKAEAATGRFIVSQRDLVQASLGNVAAQQRVKTALDNATSSLKKSSAGDSSKYKSVQDLMKATKDINKIIGVNAGQNSKAAAKTREAFRATASQKELLKNDLPKAAKNSAKTLSALSAATSRSAKNMGGLGGAIKKVPGNKKIKIEANTLEARLAVGSLQRMIDLLHGKTVRVQAQVAAGVGGAFANGTNFAPGGSALVGERGPEIVNLPRGAQVIPNHQIRSAGNGGGVTILRVGDREFRAYAEEIADSRVGAHARMGNIASRAARR